jgi:hypothetical protein
MPSKCCCEVCTYRDAKKAEMIKNNKVAKEKRRYFKETGIGTKGTLTVKTLEKMWARS